MPFPDGHYLAIKLSANGAVAIFCGKKDTAANICNKAVDVYGRGLPIPPPSAFSDTLEVGRLYFLHSEHFGADSPITASSRLGIYAHHGNTPHGLRLAIEHAMKESLVKVVVCTSTLAQGVNLPIRYLLVTTVYQGADRIKVRDFHNLIGRAGRSGKHTEGSIIFADPDVYDKREAGEKEKKRWLIFKKLLDAANSEPCASTILNILLPLKNLFGDDVSTIDWVSFVRFYVEQSERLDQLPAYIHSKLNARTQKYLDTDSIKKQLDRKVEVLASIESYLMSHLDEGCDTLTEQQVKHLAEDTLAYHLASEEQRIQIVNIFQLLSTNITASVKERQAFPAYGKTLYGIRKTLKINDWLEKNLDNVLGSVTCEDMLKCLWELICLNVSNSTFRKTDDCENLLHVCISWIKGDNYKSLLDLIHRLDLRYMWGKQRRNFKMDQVVDLCESGFGYDATLVIGAVSVLLNEHLKEKASNELAVLQKLQKQLKYGVPTPLAICLYENGLSDRMISQAIATKMEGCKPFKSSIMMWCKKYHNDIWPLIHKYPLYYHDRFASLSQGQ